MTNKRCLIYETLGKVSDLQIVESENSNEMRLHGIFGVCGIKNQNNRVYDKDNYGQMVESLQKEIQEHGCPGELEHPNSMNINLQNVSHKIEDIQMNEDGTITGTILLLNTPSGKIAKAIVEGGLPLYISSRGAGTITNEGRVTLSTIKTYDLVGTPGFSQAKLTLKPNQTLECLNEGLDNDTNIWAVIDEGKDDDDLLDSNNDKDKDSNDNESKDKSKEESKDKSKEEPKDNENDDNKNNGNDNIDMKELKEAIDKLTEKVESLEAELHVAQESLNETKESIKPINYEAIEKWCTEEFAPSLKNEFNEDVEEKIQNSINESIESLMDNVQNWIVEEFAPEVQNWVVEEFSPEVQNWITEEFAPVVEGWITEEFAPEQSQTIEAKVNENVSAFMESQKAGRLDEIDSLLESISQDSNSDVNKIIKEQAIENKYKGVFVVENMPSQYTPQWELLDEARQQEIIRTSKMYDFSKEGVLESFWANQDLSKTTVTNKVNESVNPINSYQMSIVEKMKALRNHAI